MTDEEEFDKAFEGFGEEKPEVTPAVEVPVVVPAPVVEPVEEPKKDETPVVEPVKEEVVTPPPVNEEPAKKEVEPVKTEEPATEPEVPTALTKDDVTSIINNIRTEERTSAKELENTTKEVMDAYYPDGLSNVLVDQASGKELRTPQDVVDASNDTMSTEDAAQWLINEQFKLDQDVARIKGDAAKIAETTVNFKRDSITAVQKYAPLFKQYPHLQAKVWDKLMKQVKIDKEKGVVLNAPDVTEHYDDYLEPYQLAYEHSNGTPATNPVVAPPAPVVPVPGAEDRMDVSGDAGPAPVNDPNDFAQQVTKALAEEI